MFLHAAAGLHVHEYSDRPSPSPAQSPPTRPRRPLLRTAWRPLAPSEAPQHQQRRHSFSPVHDPPVHDPPPSSLASSRRAASGGLAKDLAVRFREPRLGQSHTMPMASEDECSTVYSDPGDGADASARRARRRHAPRDLTRFAIAHSAPQLRTKQRRLVQIRPRLLLQLQEVGDRRAFPAFDVVPSSLVGGTIIPQLAKRFPRFFGLKPELGQDDVLVVRSDDYGPSVAAASSPCRLGDAFDDRDVLAVISARPGGCAEIALDDGSSWLASPVANGSFEFTSTGPRGHTTTARWVRKGARNSSASASCPSTPPMEPPSPSLKWTFSVIDPSTRRHPIMGSLTPDAVSVYDSYNTLSKSSGRHPPSRPFPPDAVDQADATAPRPDERASVAVAPGLNNLMLATASWVSLHRRGWPASANPKLLRSASHGRSGAAGTAGRRQTWGGSDACAASPRLSGPPSPESQRDAPDPKSDAAPGPARTTSTGRACPARGRGEADQARETRGLTKRSWRSADEAAAQGQCRPKVGQWIRRLLDRGQKKRERELARRKLEAE